MVSFDGGRATITGTFTYDISTDSLTNVVVTLTGSTYAGSYNEAFSPWNTASELGLATTANSYLLQLEFGANLDGSPVPLSTMGGYNGPLGNEENVFTTGGVEYASTSDVPEPATMAVLATGLMGLGWMRRQRG